MGRDIYGQIRNQRPGDVGYLGNDGAWSVDGHPIHAYKNGSVAIPVLMVATETIGSSSMVVSATKAVSWVMADFGLTVTGSVSDSGALRAVIGQSDSGGHSAIRALEGRVLRVAPATINDTWAMELNISTDVAGDTLAQNVGAYIASGSAGLGGAVRSDVGVLLTGDAGWHHGFRQLDTDGTTVLFDTDRYGNVIVRGTPLSVNVGNIHINSAANNAGISLYSASANAAARHWQIETNYAAFGDFLIMRGTSQGAVPTTVAFGMDNTGAARMPAYGIGTATFDGSGNITSVSDERKKDIIGPFDGGLTEVLALEPIRYHWKEDSGLNPDDLNVGFLAQQVKEVIPEAVGMDAQGFYTFSDRPVIAALVNAVKELKAEVNELKALVTA